MLRFLIAFSLFSLLYSFSIAQPTPGGDSPCPNPPCQPAFSPYKYEDVINAKKFGIAQMNTPYGITTGSDGRIYVAEYASPEAKIFIYGSDGVLQKTIDTGLSYNFSQYLISVAVDWEGNVYAGGVGYIKIFNSNGELLRHIVGSGQFDFAWDIEVDAAGNIYVLDYYNKIVVYNKDGVHLYTISIPYCNSIALDNNGGLWMADYGGHKIIRYSNGQQAQLIEGVNWPYSISFGEDDMMYVNHLKDDLTTNAISTFYQGSLLHKIDFAPNAWGNIAAAELGYIYYTDYYNSRLLKINIFSGNYTVLVRNDLPGTLYYPGPIDVAQNGNVYVFDRTNQPRLQVFDYKGNHLAMYENVVYPTKVAADNGTVYALSGGNIVVYNNGVGTDTLKLAATDFSFYQNELYVLDGLDGQIKVYNSTGVFQRSIPNNYSRFEIGPAGEIYIHNGDNIKVISNTGEFIKDLSIPVTGVSFIVDDKGFIYVNYYYYLKIYSLDGTVVQQLGESSFFDGKFAASGIAVSNGRLFISHGWLNKIEVYSSLPMIEQEDIHVNYKDWYHFLSQETANGNRITYKIKEGTAASLSFDNMLDLNSAGEVIMEASVDASTTMSKSSDEFVVFIDKAKLSLKAQNKERVYGDANPEFSIQSPYYSAIVDGLRGDDDLIEIDELPVITTEANLNSPVGEYAITFVGGVDNNYDFEFTPGTLTITKAPLQLLADNKSREYGDANPEFTYQAIGFKNNDDVQDLDSAPELITTATLASPADTYPVTLNVGLDNNYYIIPANGNLTVTKAPLQVRAQNATRAYGEPNPSFTVSFEGFKNNDTQDILVGIPTPYSDADNSSPVGQYPIVFANNTDSRYEYITTSAMLTIEKANQKITFNDLPSPIDSDVNPFSVFDYASATSNLPITFSIVSGPATINGTLVTLTGQGGTVTINATQPGNSNYNAAEPVSKSFEVNLITGTNEEPGSLTIYPNPAKDVLSISSAEGVKFQLLNSSGVPVVRHTNSFLNEHLVSTEILTKGIYFLVLQTASGNKITRKISVVK